MAFEIREESPIRIQREQLVHLCLNTLSEYLGVEIFVTLGGPSVSDPCGDVKFFVGFRGAGDTSIAFKIKDNGNIVGIHERP